MKYQPDGKRNPGRPLKGLLDCYIENGEGHQVPDSLMMMMMMMLSYSFNFVQISSYIP
jgi:hypothetical protein